MHSHNLTTAREEAQSCPAGVFEVQEFSRLLALEGSRAKISDPVGFTPKSIF